MATCIRLTIRTFIHSFYKLPWWCVFLKHKIQCWPIFFLYRLNGNMFWTYRQYTWYLKIERYGSLVVALNDLLIRTPGPVPFGTCICSNVETILSWTCHVYGPFEFRTSLGTSILLCMAPLGCGGRRKQPTEFFWRCAWFGIQSMNQRATLNWILITFQAEVVALMY